MTQLPLSPVCGFCVTGNVDICYRHGPAEVREAAQEIRRAASLSPLAARVLTWTREHATTRPVPFSALCEAMPGVGASDVDAAAKEAGVLRWVASEGVRGRFDVCAEGAEGVET